MTGKVERRPAENRTATEQAGGLELIVDRAADIEPRRIAHYPRRDGRLPEGARWVGRPSRWGNPHKVDPRICPSCQVVHTSAEAVELYRDRVLPDLDLEPLRSATALACKCPIGEPCHADVLLARLSTRLLGVIR